MLLTKKVNINKIYILLILKGKYRSRFVWNHMESYGNRLHFASKAPRCGVYLTWCGRLKIYVGPYDNRPRFTLKALRSVRRTLICVISWKPTWNRTIMDLVLHWKHRKKRDGSYFMRKFMHENPCKTTFIDLLYFQLSMRNEVHLVFPGAFNAKQGLLSYDYI